MAKQIKIGLDKVPSPLTKEYTQLVDIEGTKLYDAAGNPLVTEEDASIAAFSNSANALSTFVNNTPTDGGSIGMIEQFPETSEVSSSLLGIPRSEEQLSLFSDVATYGLDEDAWEEYTFSDITVPYQWYRKKHPIHGRRSNPQFREGSTEQALYLRTFPSQYSYPMGPRASLETDPTPGFIRYMNFVALGRFLYMTFTSRGFTEFANTHFLDSTSANVIDSNTPSTNLTPNLSQLTILPGTTFVFKGNTGFYDVDYGKDDIQESFDAIERWTFFFEKMKKGEAFWPESSLYGDFSEEVFYRGMIEFATSECLPGGSSTRFQIASLESKRAFRYQPGRASGFTFGSRMTSDPISQATVLEWGAANESDQYVFQLKGTQFNILRRSTIPLPAELLVRQGLTSDDQSSEPKYIRGIGNTTKLWETVIPRSKWNGDNLLGVGDSGYILSFEDVTMYKIEFSWYGAIGAKFYAYIPSGNGEARWALLHTLVIENGLGQPVLQNPDFKFKYCVYSTNTATIESPIMLYKYGSSYFIDGGDEGTQRLTTVSTSPKAVYNRTPIIGLLPKNQLLNNDGIAITNNKKSYPTTISVNASKSCRIDLVEIKGCKDGVHFNYSPSIHMNGRNPRTRDLTFKYTGGDTSLQIVQPTTPQITGTVYVNDNETTLNGVNTAFETDLQVGDFLVIGTDSTEHKIEKINSNTELKLTDVYTNSENSSILQANAVTANLVYRLNSEDNLSKIIADGVYNTYVNTSVTGSQSSPVVRRSVDPHDFSLTTGIIVRDSLKTDGSTLDRSVEFTGKLVNQHTVVASDTPITSNRFKIHFLNPEKRDGTYGNRHYAEFGVTVTPHKPVEQSDTETFDRLHFETSPGNFKEFDREEFPVIDFCHDRTRFLEREQAEFYEWHGPYGKGRHEVDPRNTLPTFALTSSGQLPSNHQSGYISAIQGKVEVKEYAVLATLGDYIESDGVQYASMKRLIFTSANTPNNSEIKFTGKLSGGAVDPNSGISEIGAGFVGSGYNFKSPIIIPGAGNRYAYVDANITNLGATTNTEAGDIKSIQTKVLTLSSDFQAQSFDDDGKVLFPYHEFTVSQAIAFNDQPLYPVFALQDQARVNGIAIEEIFEDGRVIVHTPTFKKDDASYNSHINIDNSIPIEDRALNGHSGDATTSSSLPPASFNEEDRMSGLRYDKSCINSLRAGNTIYSFYVEADDPAKIDLDNIFAQDRKGLSTGLLNNTALYFTATDLDDQTAAGTVEVALTIKEQ